MFVINFNNKKLIISDGEDNLEVNLLKNYPSRRNLECEFLYILFDIYNILQLKIKYINTILYEYV